MQYGYVRVSTREQKIDRQLVALEEFGIAEKNIFCDYQSGKDFERPQYQKLIRKLRDGDLLVIKSIDRLGRNYADILVQWQHITKEIGADIVVLDMELLDTRKSPNDLTGTLIADLVLQLLAYVAQTEREFIRQRQREGIAAAKERGVRFGRPAKPVPQGFYEICGQCGEGKLSTREAASLLGMNHSTFYRNYRLCRKRETDGNGGVEDARP